MRLTTQESPVQRHNVTEQARYANIEMNATAFEVLSSSIYTNKPLAVVRELCANALDAHTAAGQGNPFELHLPTQLSSELIVRDFGTGLSHDAIVYLYMTYFGSNKRLTDELIGGFGLGSKSPLAYTDSFVVISTYNGHRSTYSVYKDEAGMPAVQRLSEEHTDAHNGLEVRVAVAPGDFHLFAGVARTLLPYFPPGSVVCPTHPEFATPVTYHSRNSLWGHRSSGPYSYVRAVVGPISYDVDFDNFSFQEMADAFQDQRYQIRNNSYDLFFDIGDVSVAVSREALQFDKKTKAAVIERLQLVLKEEAGAFASEVRTAPYLFDALCALSRAACRNMLSHEAVCNAARPRFTKVGAYQLVVPQFAFKQVCHNPKSQAVPYHMAKADRLREYGNLGLHETVSRIRSTQSTITQPTFIFIDKPLKRSLTKFIELNPELNPVIKSEWGLFFVYPQGGLPDNSFEWFRDNYHPNVVRASDILQDLPKAQAQSAPSLWQRGFTTKERAAKDVWAARHYSYPQTTNGSSLTTYKADRDLDPDGEYCFVPLDELQQLFLDPTYRKYITAILDHTGFRKAALKGARLICLSSSPPKYVANNARRYPSLRELLDAIPTDVLGDPGYLRARQAVERFLYTKEYVNLPLDHPDSNAEFRVYSHTKANRRLRHIHHRLAQAESLIRSLRAKYNWHFTIDGRDLNPSRPATVFDRLANFYEQHPVAFLIATHSLAHPSYWSSSYNPIRYAALQHLISLETAHE